MEKTKILVVEDEAITAQDLEGRLSDLGYHVVGLALSGEEAVASAGALHPDVVLMDIRLKGAIDGTEAANRIRASVGTPVVFLTAFADDATLARAKDSAPYGYIVKPFSERDLHATLQTALRRRQLELEQEEVNRLKGDMIAAVSHDLRASFASVMALTELFAQGGLGLVTPEQAVRLQVMEDRLHRMLDVVRTALDFARLDRQGTVLDLKPVDVGEVVRGLQREIADLPYKSGVSEIWQIEPDLPRVTSDPVKLLIIFRNLITNALKYTTAGSVTVTVRRAADGVEFLVADTGPGISAETRRTLFTPATRGVEDSRETGVGLGLYIAHRFAGMLGVAIDVTSEVGVGSTFSLSIPLQPTTAHT